MLRLANIITVFVCITFSLNVFSSSLSESDSLALVSLYNSTQGEDWVKSDNWLSGPLNEWYGLLFENDKVIAINLSGNNLVGALPDELYNLDELKYIYVSYNELSGTIKEAVGGLKKLEVFWASYNNLSGVLPTAIGDLDSLKTLYLNDNDFNGSIPNTIGQLKKLENLNLSNNAFSGDVPTEIGDLGNLKYLTLNNNQFTGEIPASVQNLSMLRSLRVDYNKFTEIPDLTGLTHLKNSAFDNPFQIQYNYLDFSDILKNKTALGAQDNYFPQREFVLTNILNLHPGDDLILDMPSMSYVDTSDPENSYRYLRDNAEVRAWSSEKTMNVDDAVYNDNGSYVCQVKHESFPDLIITVSRIRLLPPAGYAWISLGVKIDGPIVDTVDYKIDALKKNGDDFVAIEVDDSLINKRKEFLIPTGTYLINLVPQNEDTVLFTKYHKNNIRWVNNQLTTLGNRKDYAYNVTLLEKNFMSGAGEISGTIVESELAPGEVDPLYIPAPKDSVNVLLYSETLASWVNQRVTPESGRYAFSGLDNGIYRVYIDVPGYEQDKYTTIEITSEEPMVDSVNFTLYMNNNVVVGLEKPIVSQFLSEDFKVWANSNNTIRVLLNSSASSKADLTIFDLSGKIVYMGSMTGGDKTIEVPGINKGVYILRVKIQEFTMVKKFIVR